MPRTGTPSSNTAAGARGGSRSVTDSGPPQRITARGAKARTSASSMSQGRISQYTPNSRTRRAISWVYWAPKSRIRMRCAWMSGCAVGPRLGGSGRGTLAIGSSGHPVVGCFLGNGHIVHVTFAHACGRDAHEHRAGAHVRDITAAGIAHGGPQSSGKLVQDGDDAALVRHASLDALGHQLLQLRGRILGVAVGRAVAFPHRAK